MISENYMTLVHHRRAFFERDPLLLRSHLAIRPTSAAVVVPFVAAVAVPFDLAVDS